MQQKSVYKFIFSIVILFVSTLLFTNVVQAGSLNDKVLGQLNAGKTSAGYTDAVAPQVTIASVIKIFLGFIGSIFIILIAMASYWFIIARGRSEKIEKASATMRGAVIGLFILVLSYAITSFVASGLQKAVQEPQSSDRFDCLEDESCWDDFAG